MELLSPAGGFDAALAAFQYGADAVYLGMPRFSARADADNLTPDRLRTLLAYAKTFSPAKKIYVTFNTVVQETELSDALDALAELDELLPDGLIVQDLGIASLIRKNFPRLALHASTQLAVHSLAGVTTLRRLGFSRVVLARELTLAEIREICRRSGTEIEIFVHGALCYSISGLCLFSSHEFGRSGNRGRCAYCCRQPFGGRFPFSMKDLSLAPLLDEIAATGASSLKIEGRMKSPLYVACVTDYYRKKLDHRLSPEEDAAMVQDLQTVFSRPWTRLYAEGTELPPMSVIDPIGMGHRGARIGTAERARHGILRVSTNRTLEKHDGIQVELPQGGRPYGFAIQELRRAGNPRTVLSVPAGETAEIALPEDAPAIPVGSPVFCSSSQAVKRRYEIRSVRKTDLPIGKPLDVSVRIRRDRVEASATTSDGTRADARCSSEAAAANQPERTPEAVRRAFERMGGSGWRLGKLAVEDPAGLYVPPSRLNELRRQLVEQMNAAAGCRRERARAELRETLTTEHVARAEPPKRILKFRLDRRPPVPERLTAAEAVLMIGHLHADAIRTELDKWKSTLADETGIRLALPIWTRDADTARQEETVAQLVRDGWCRWEAADLSGCARLRERGVEDVTGDWSCYAFNHVAVEAWEGMGIRRLVLSSENGRENWEALLTLPFPTELLVYQHTPLFLAVTKPMVPALDERTSCEISSRADRFFVERQDDLWVTIRREPYCLAERTAELPAATAWRYDFSWTPETELVRALIALEKDRLPSTNEANYVRGLQ